MRFRQHASWLIDSHCHLQLLTADDCRRALDLAREAGVRGFLVPAITLRDCDRLLELASSEENVWCALGVHPHEAASWQPGDSNRLLALLKEPGVVAVGECGLDFYYDRSPRDVQLAVMEKQWEVALEASLPVVVHNRESNHAMLEAALDPRFVRLRGVFHSFAGGLPMARELVERGFTLGYSGMVTFNAADNVREVLPVTPWDRLLVETDTPYLAPVPYRGKPNQPAYVVEIADRIGRELDRSPQEVAGQTTQNFFDVFDAATSWAG